MTVGAGDGSAVSTTVGLADGDAVTAEGLAEIDGEGVPLADGETATRWLGDARRNPPMGAPDSAAAMITTMTPDTAPMSNDVPSSRPVIG